CYCFFFQAEDGIRDFHVTGVQTCALPILMFVDNQSRYHQGAREVYDALMMTDATHADLVDQHKKEREFVGAMRHVLASRGLTFRSEERRVGKERRSRRSPEQERKLYVGRE